MKKGLALLAVAVAVTAAASVAVTSAGAKSNATITGAGSTFVAPLVGVWIPAWGKAFGDSVQSIPLTIFTYSESADPNLHAQAWAAAFILIVFVLVTSLTARFLLDRSRRKLGLQR